MSTAYSFFLSDILHSFSQPCNPAQPHFTHSSTSVLFYMSLQGKSMSTPYSLLSIGHTPLQSTIQLRTNSLLQALRQENNNTSTLLHSSSSHSPKQLRVHSISCILKQPFPYPFKHSGIQEPSNTLTLLHSFYGLTAR